MPPRRARGESSKSRGRSTSSKGQTSRSRSRSRGNAPARQASPPPLPWPMRDNEMQNRYNSLATRPFQCTRYIDEDALHHLELHGPVHNYFSRMGWNQFVAHRPPSFTELTLEFLSSMNTKVFKYNDEDNEEIQFRLVGREYTLTVAQVNHMFGFPVGVRRVADPYYDYQNTWRTLADDAEDYQSGKSKESKLRDHALRYIHRFMAHSIFARGESQGVVTRQELYILNAMCSGEPVNMGYWIIKHLQTVARSSSGRICVGGIISMIANVCQAPLDVRTLTRTGGSERIDLPMLLMMKVCARGRDGNYYLQNHDGTLLPKQTHHNIPDFPMDRTALNEHSEAEIQEEPHIPDNPPPQTHDNMPSSSQLEPVTLHMLMQEMRAMRVDLTDFRRHVDDRLDMIETRIEGIEEMFDYMNDNDD